MQYEFSTDGRTGEEVEQQAMRPRRRVTWSLFACPFWHMLQYWDDCVKW